MKPDREGREHTASTIAQRLGVSAAMKPDREGREHIWAQVSRE